MPVQTFSAEALRARRKQFRFSRRLLALAIGKTAETIYNYEHERTVPTVDVLAQIAGALECRVEDFFEESDG